MDADAVMVRKRVAEWLDGQEGFSLRRERLYDETAANPASAAVWLEEAFKMGFTAAVAEAKRPPATSDDGWVNDRRACAEEVRRFPWNTCPPSRHLNLMADALADDGRYAIIEDDPEHVAGSIYAVLAELWTARDRIAELEARAARGMEAPGPSGQQA